MNLHEIGPMLYGPYWQTPFAKAMHVTNMTVHRWLITKPPAERNQEIRHVAIDRRQKLVDAGELRAREMAAAMWKTGAATRVAELTGFSRVTVNKDPDWQRWRDQIDGKRMEFIRGIDAWLSRHDVMQIRAHKPGTSYPVQHQILLASRYGGLRPGQTVLVWGGPDGFWLEKTSEADEPLAGTWAYRDDLGSAHRVMRMM